MAGRFETSAQSLDGITAKRYLELAGTVAGIADAYVSVFSAAFVFSQVELRDLEMAPEDGPRLLSDQKPLAESLIPDWCGADPHSGFYIGDRLAIDLAKPVGGAGMQNEHVAFFDLPCRAAFCAHDIIINRIGKR